MAYEKQNFENGKVLDASELNYIEDGIVDLETTVHTDIRNRIVMTNIVETVRDDAATVSGSSGVELAGLRIFGKTVQDGTPAPDAPVALESVGDGGNVEVVLANSNLLNFPYMASSNTANGLTFVVQPDGSIVINGTATKETLFNLATVDSKTFYLPKGKVTFSGIPSGTFGGNLRPQLWVTNGAGYSFSVYAEGKTVDITTPGYYRIAVDIVAGNALTDYVVKPMVNLGETTLLFESPASHQTLTASTPNGLSGIPVSSGGNYTDESGQQWVCDELDFEKGVYIQRIKTVKLADLSGGYNGTNFYFTSTPDKKIGITNLLCSHYPVRAGYDDFTCKGNASQPYLHIYDSRYTDFNTLKTEMGDADIIYELATPVETALSTDELTAYAALHTNYPNTTVFNDGGADMEVRYVADTKAYVDEKHVNGFVGAFSGSFDEAQTRLNTGIYLKSGKKYLIKKTKAIGTINLFVEWNTSVYRRMQLATREAYFTPAISGNLVLYNVNGDIGNVAIEVYDADSITVKLDDIPRVYTVGKTQQDYDYTSFTQCLLDLKDDYSPKIIYINEGDYDIYAEYKAAGVPSYTGDSPTYDFPDYCVYIPPNTHVIGRGVVRLMWMPDPEATGLTYNESATVSPVNCAGTMTLENVEIHCKNGRYCIHDDPLGDAEFTNAIKKYINVRCYKYANDTGFGFNATIGFGVDRTMRYEFHNCLFKNEGTGAAFYMHDRKTVGSTNLSAEMGSNLIVSNCVMDASGTSCVKFGNSSSVAHIRVDFNSCWFSGQINCVNESSSAETVYPNSWDLKLCLCNQVEINIADTDNLYPPAVYSNG